ETGQREAHPSNPATPDCDLDDGKPPATLEPARAQNLASRAGAHPLQEPMLAPARDTLGLPRPLHTVLTLRFRSTYPLIIRFPLRAVKCGGPLVPLSVWVRS